LPVTRRKRPSRVTFTTSAGYLGSDQLDRPTFGNLGPEMSRRARSLAVWATLRAYGRAGYRSMIERHLALAQRLAAQIDAEPDLERLAGMRGGPCAPKACLAGAGGSKLAFRWKRQPEAREFLGHPPADYLQRRGWAEHHLQLRDPPVLVERELVDALDLPAVHLGRELQNGYARVAVLELLDVAELAAEPEHSLGRFKNHEPVSRPA